MDCKVAQPKAVAPQRVAVIVAHPDDAELAAGGTIGALVTSGHEVTMVHATVSEFNPKLRGLRIEAAQRAAEILGARVCWLENQRLNQVEELPQYRLVGIIDAFLREYKPHAVFTHWEHDSHFDHVMIARAVNSSLRRHATNLYAMTPNEFRTPAYQNFAPSVVVDISDYVSRKMEALRCYSYEGQGFRELDIESYRALDAARGLRFGYSSAEGFMVVRHHGVPGL